MQEFFDGQWKPFKKPMLRTKTDETKNEDKKAEPAGAPATDTNASAGAGPGQAQQPRRTLLLLT